MGGSGSFPPPNNCNHYLGGRWVYSNTNNTCPVSITITFHLLLYMFYIFKFVSQLKKKKKFNLFFYFSLFSLFFFFLSFSTSLFSFSLEVFSGTYIKLLLFLSFFILFYFFLLVILHAHPLFVFLPTLYFHFLLEVFSWYGSTYV